jgi:hypothetical protein
MNVDADLPLQNLYGDLILDSKAEPQRKMCPWNFKNWF